MDHTLTFRTPLKIINSEIAITPVSKKPYKQTKKRKLLIENDSDAQETSLDFFEMDVSSEQKIDEPCGCLDYYTGKTDESLAASIRKYTEPKVNKLFMEDLRCPELSPFSQINYSCNSARSCKYENHKIIAKQISETQEKALTFLAKSWYMLTYPLTCLISEQNHLSSFVLRFLFYGILNEKDETVCLRIKDIIKGHLGLHPSCNSKLRTLYNDALVGNIDNLDPSNPDIVFCNFRNIFDAIGKIVTELNMNQPINKTKVEVNKSLRNFDIPENIEDLYKIFSDNYMKTGKMLPSSIISSNNNLEEEKDELDSESQLKRHFMVFSLMVDILEENFRIWWMKSRYYLQKKLFSNNNCPIIANIAWDTKQDRGLLNEHCIKTFELFKSCPKEYKLEIARYITLLSEVVRTSEDNLEKKFPYFGKNCEIFAKELSSYVNIETEEKCSLSMVELIHPLWLRFKVCGYILKCELTSGGVNDLNSILKILQRNLSPRPNSVLKAGEPSKNITKNSILQKDKIVEKINKGITDIHKYCKTNDHKALSLALKRKETDINTADNAGWTPLHYAAKYNAVNCFKLLIRNYLSTKAGAERINIFAVNSDNDTPLACAVKEGNEEIIRILLNNGAGVGVWNMVSSGLSVVDHAQTKHLKEMLIEEWTRSTSNYRNLNMNPMEIDLVYYMLSSYCSVFHIGELCTELEPELCKPDSHYDFDYSQFSKDEKTLYNFFELVERLSYCRSCPKNLNKLQFYLKCRVKSVSMCMELKLHT